MQTYQFRTVRAGALFALVSVAALTACGSGTKTAAADSALQSETQLANQQSKTLDSVAAVEAADSTERARREGYGSAASNGSNGDGVAKHTDRDAVIGAAAGAVVGASTSKNKLQGGVIGGVVGGVLGGVVGNNVDKTKTKPPPR